MQSALVAQGWQPGLAVWTQPLTALHASVVHAFPSSQLRGDPTVQIPDRHVSAPLHTLPSLHEVPLATAGCRQPVTGSQVSVVHGFPSSQLRDDPAVQIPDRHVSAPLHTLPSLHEVPLASAVCRHPLTGSQVSVVHGLLSLQLSPVPARQMPAWQVSAPLHTLPSLHEVPFASAACWHPASGSQVSALHGLLSLQSRAVPATHTPAWQVSTPLHASPSLHDVPFGSAVCRHPATGSQVSVVQGLLSLQLRPPPPVHTPAWHVSAPLHASPSPHDVPFGGAVCRQPASGSQASVVQGLLSLQLRAAPAVQIPDRHVSAPLHTLPSLHDVPFATAVC